jgi:peptide chain release factor 1
MAIIDENKKEYENLLEQLSSPELISNRDKFEELSRKKAYLEKIIEKQEELNDLKKRIEENKTIITAQEDPELISLAESEIIQLKEKEKIIEADLKKLIKDKENDSKYASSVIIEIRAGTGGDEAAIFAADLFRAYSKYSQTQGWKQKVLDSKPTELGGFKEIIFELSGKDTFDKLKNEAGVHRVQRIPKTEKSGRIHTSTVSVAVLPKPKKGKILINPADLKIDTYKSSGKGGQNVNKRMTAVRITHLPTNLVVTSQTERSLQQNKENALSILEARLLEIKEKEEEKEIVGKRRMQIGKAKRAEKIRTYNFPQDRVTDHRLKKSWHNIEEIMSGKLDPIISLFTSQT